MEADFGDWSCCGCWDPREEVESEFFVFVFFIFFCGRSVGVALLLGCVNVDGF